MADDFSEVPPSAALRPPSIADRHPLGLGDIHTRLAAVEAHIRALLTGIPHDAKVDMGLAAPQEPEPAEPGLEPVEGPGVPDIGGDAFDSGPMDD